MRFGIVGAGWAARSFHLPALKQIPGVEVVGGCDPSVEQRSRWERESELPCFESLEQLAEQARPEVVVVATPPDSHAALCIEALQSGMHVFCEKPFAADALEADRVLAASTVAGRAVAVNHEFREWPIFKALQRRIGSPEAGRLVFCQIWQLMDLPPWDEPVQWRAQMPNRTLFEGGVHLIDLLLTLYGEQPSTVYAAHTSGLDAERNADAIHLVTLQFPDDRLAQVTIDRLCRAGTRYVEIRADCERESLRASLGGRAIVQLGKKRAEKTGVRIDFGQGGMAWAECGLRRKTLARNPRNYGVHGTVELLKQFVEAVREGREPPSSGREARNVIAVIDAAYTSARDGRRIEIDCVPTPA